MDSWSLGWLIAIVLGVIASNILVLKYTAKMKFPKETLDAIKEKKAHQNKSDDPWDDD